MDKPDCTGNHKPLWGVLLFLLSGVLVSGGIGWTQNEGMQSRNDTQDVQIENMDKNFERLERQLGIQHIEQATSMNKVMDKLDDINKYIREHEHE